MQDKGYLTDFKVKRGIDNASSERELVFYLLYSVMEKDGFSNLVIKSANTKLNLDFVSAMFYGTITMSYSIDFLIKHATRKSVSDMDPSTRTLLRMGSWQILFSDKVPDFAATKTTVDLARKLGLTSYSFINALLRRISEMEPEKKDINNYKAEVATSLSPEIFGVLKKSYGKEKALAIGKALLSRPNISIRTNLLKTTTSELKSSLVQNGVRVTESGLPDSLIIDGVQIDSLKEFKDGLFFVQNEAAQLVGLVAGNNANKSVLDCCSAPGGKATHIAELSSDKAKILALDINESRLELIKENAERLGISSIDVSKADSMNLDLTIGKEEFDMVLCDVPCSGLGLMSRKPDIRQTITYERIEELLPKQKKILSSGSKHVRKGGRLIYSTCTMNKKENEETIAWFLDNNKDFKTVDISDLVPSGIDRDDSRVTDMKNGYITLFPDTDGFDGFFLCLMERI